MQGSGVSSMFVLAINILLCDQLLHSIKVAFLGRIQQSCLTSEEVGYVTVLLVLDHVQRSEVVPVATVYVSSILDRR